MTSTVSNASWLVVPPVMDFLTTLRDALPEPHKVTSRDIATGFALQAAIIALLIPSPTRPVLLARSAIAPFIAAGLLHISYVGLLSTPQERWGTACLFFNFAFRTIELLAVFPAEFNNYRLRPAQLDQKIVGKDIDASDGRHDTTNAFTRQPQHQRLVPEPVPPGWTLAKLEWATSLWWSWRGIGWNYSPPLPASMRRAPYARGSRRGPYLRSRAIELAVALLAHDVACTYMRSKPDIFYSATTPYASLSTSQRAVASIATVERIWFSLQLSHIICSILFVSIGGWIGIDHELLSPWGWVPMFGSLADIWANPGLTYMWSRAWNQYYRRLLHLWGWDMIGERLLRLPVSGHASNVPPLPKELQGLQPKTNGVIIGNGSPDEYDQETHTHNGTRKGTANGNGANVTCQHSDGTTFQPQPRSVNHLSPMPPFLAKAHSPVQSTTPSPLPSGRASPSTPLSGRDAPHMTANLAKSAITFVLSGIVHDYGSLVMTLDKVGRGETVNSWREVFPLLPFFAVQPAALVAEALIRRAYRSYKRRGLINTVPRPAVTTTTTTTLERAVAFACTWIWLGWSAAFFVEGMCKLCVWPLWPGDEPWSLFWWVFGV